MLLHLRDHAFDALHAALHRVVAQVGRIKAGVEMESVRKGIGNCRLVAVWQHESVAARHGSGR